MLKIIKDIIFSFFVVHLGLFIFGFICMLIRTYCPFDIVIRINDYIILTGYFISTLVPFVIFNLRTEIKNGFIEWVLTFMVFIISVPISYVHLLYTVTELYSAVSGKPF